MPGSAKFNTSPDMLIFMYLIKNFVKSIFHLQIRFYLLSLSKFISIFIYLSTFRCEDYAISLLEQCEDLREVEIFLQTKYSGNKDANYILAILGACCWCNLSLQWIQNMTISDSRMKFVAHERFQYVLLNKFGKLVDNVR